MLNDAVNNSSKQRGRPFRPGQSGNARGRPRGSRNKRTIAQQEIVASGMSPLEFLCAVYRDPTQSMTRRIEAARCALPYLHPRISTTEFVPPSKPHEINRIRISFVKPDGTRVPFRPPPELKKIQTFNSPSEAAR